MATTGPLITSDRLDRTVPEPPTDVAFSRRAAYLETADALVLADVHLGRDRQSDVQLPLGEREDVLDRLEGLLDRFDPREVVVAGDLLHSFGRVPDGVGDTVAGFRDAIEATDASLVVTPGNHDGLLDEVFDGPTPDEHRLADGTVVCHGHEVPDASALRYVVGHDHPVVTVEGRRHPCFLHGERPFRGSDVLVLPVFSRLARGVTVGGRRGDEFLSPLLAGGAGDYHPIVYDGDADEALAFPPLRVLREHL